MGQNIQERFFRRRERVIAAILRACKGSGRSHEWARYDAADKIGIAQFSRNLTGPVQFFQWYDFFVSRDLKDGIGACIHNPEPFLHVLSAQFFDNRCSRGRFVSDNGASCFARKFFRQCEREGRMLARKYSKAFVEVESHQFPVPRGGIFSLGEFTEGAEVGFRFLYRGDTLDPGAARDDGSNISQPETLEGREANSSHRLCCVRQSVRARIAVRLGVGSGANPDGVEDNQERAHMNTE